jgi:hypothetical protein
MRCVPPVAGYVEAVHGEGCTCLYDVVWLTMACAGCAELGTGLAELQPMGDQLPEPEPDPPEEKDPDEVMHPEERRNQERGNRGPAEIPGFGQDA